MMSTLDAIATYWGLDLPLEGTPFEIPNVGRNDLGPLFASLGFTRGAEIGVAEGVYSETLCQGNSALRLMCVDPWAVQSDYRNGTDDPVDAESNYAEAVARLAPYRVNIIRATSMVALRFVPDDTLDFVYIDANHDFPHVTEDICGWSRKVRSGGIVAGHDYFLAKARANWGHVKLVVDALTNAYRINPWFVLGRKWAADGEVRDHNRSFFWVKT